jgi:hypothetical protein
MLTAMRHRDDPQRHISDAEVMTTAIVAALFFGGNLAASRCFLHTHGYIPRMVSTSRFHRRLQRIQSLFVTLFNVLGEHWKALNADSIYVIDTFPIPVCDPIRIARAKLYRGEVYRGYQASKRRYFYGLKVHLMVTRDGHPVEFFVTPGSYSDTAGLADFNFDLPDGAWVFGDKAYNHYEIEDVLADVGIGLFPFRKKNSKRPLSPCLRFLQSHYRTVVERTGSLLARLLPKSIHAVTPRGFELKVVLFILAVSLRGFLTA